MDHDGLKQSSKPFRQGYGACRNGRPLHDNPYNVNDLGGLYAAQQWVAGWKEAEGDMRGRAKLNEMVREIADKIKKEESK